MSSTTIASRAASHSPKDVLARRVDGALSDLSAIMSGDRPSEPVFRSDADALSLIRHDTAHVLAQDVSELFPGTALATGPATEQGFFYDFAVERPLTDDDLERIEARMPDIVNRDEAIIREAWNRESGLAWCRANRQH